MLEGEMPLPAGPDGEKTVGPNWYAARKPGVIHGTVSSETSCLMIDFCWYEEEEGA